MKKRITEEEVRKLYEKYGTPDHVKAHCRAVADTGVKLADSLNKHGYNLDLDLIKGAGLAHDVARTGEEHWNVGADALEALGYCTAFSISLIVIRPFSLPSPSTRGSFSILWRLRISCASERVVPTGAVTRLSLVITSSIFTLKSAAF